MLSCLRLWLDEVTALPSSAIAIHLTMISERLRRGSTQASRLHVQFLRIVDSSRVIPSPLCYGVRRRFRRVLRGMVVATWRCRCLVLLRELRASFSTVGILDWKRA